MKCKKSEFKQRKTLSYKFNRNDRSWTFIRYVKIQNMYLALVSKKKLFWGSLLIYLLSYFYPKIYVWSAMSFVFHIRDLWHVSRFLLFILSD